MNKIKRCILFVLMSLLTLNSCSKSSYENKNINKNRMIAYYRDKNTTVSLNGGLNVVNYKIRYQDFDTNTTVFLCNKEGCAHKDRECNADVFDMQGEVAFFYNNQIYVLGLPNLEGLQLWKMDTDGTSRKKLIEKVEGHRLEDMFLVENKLYYTATELVLDDSENEQVGASENFGIVGVIDLESNKATTLWNGKEGKYEIEKMIVSGDGVCYMVNHKSEDYKAIGDRIWSDTTMTEDEKVFMLIEEQGKCELVQKVYYLAADSEEAVEKYSYTTTLNNPISLQGASANGILMASGDGYFYLGDVEKQVYQKLGNITVTDNYVLTYDGQNTEIILYDILGENMVTRVTIDPPEDYFDKEISIEAESEFDMLIPGYTSAEQDERVWFLCAPFFSDGENLFFDFVDGMETSVWVLKVSELAEGKCIWHRGV